MKKNKLSNAPSQNTSPVPYRKSFQDLLTRPSLFLSDPDINLDEDALGTRSILPNDRNSIAFAGTTIRNDYETIDKRRPHRGSNYDDQKDHGYETIPATAPPPTAAGSNQTAASDDGTEQHRTRSSAPAGIYSTRIKLGWTVWSLSLSLFYIIFHFIQFTICGAIFTCEAINCAVAVMLCLLHFSFLFFPFDEITVFFNTVLHVDRETIFDWDAM